MTDAPHNWETDPRSVAECLRDWAGRHGVAHGVAPWVASVTGEQRRTVESWLSGRGPGSPGMLRRLMTYYDQFGPHDSGAAGRYLG